MTDAAGTAVAILGLAVVTLVARGSFLFSERSVEVPEAVRRALQVAPLAALVAVLAPEIALNNGQLIDSWREARLLGALAATLCYVWRPGVLGPLVAGLAVYLPLRVTLGW